MKNIFSEKELNSLFIDYLINVFYNFESMTFWYIYQNQDTKAFNQFLFWN